MLSKCANSSCSNPFLYLHNGKLFRMDMPVESDPGNVGEGRVSRRVEFFWLCNECARTMTLSHRHGVGVVATPLVHDGGKKILPGKATYTFPTRRSTGS